MYQIQRQTTRPQITAHLAQTMTLLTKSVVELNEEIEKELASSGDEQMLQDLVLAAVNAALDKAGAMVEEETKKITGGMSLPGM